MHITETHVTHHPIRLIYAQAYPILLALALVLSACTSAAALPTQTPAAIPSATATQTPTILPSVTATSTVVAASSPTQTAEPSPTPQPTSTPLVPTPGAGQVYRLTDWTPEKAELLIQYLKDYPNNLEAWAYFPGGNLYERSFQYESLAELESALHFPQSAQRHTWLWDSAYNLYHSGNKEVVSLYADLITNALNQKETNLQDLGTSFAKSIHFRIDTYPITPPAGYQKSTVLHLYELEYGEGVSYGFAIWLVQKEGKFYSYPLPNGDTYDIGGKYSNVGIADVTGDGIAEAIVQTLEEQSFGQHSGDMRIYRLDQVPPREVSFDTLLPDPEIAQWSVDQNQPVPTIIFQMPIYTLSDRPCNTFLVGWQYQWQEDTLKFVQVIPPSGEAIKQDHPWCTRYLISKLSNPEYLKNQAVLETYKQLLDLPFIEKDIASFETSFSVEKQRLKLALFLSDQGDEAGAREQMRRISESTNVSSAEWRKDAAAYFAVHHNPQALLQFCLSSQHCEAFLNHSQMIELIPPSRFSETDTLLKQMGINIHAAGNYDFGQDGQVEKWLIFLSPYPCNGFTEFWVLANIHNSIKSLSATSLCLSDEEEIGTSVNIKSIGSSGGLPVYQVSMKGEQRLSQPFLYWPLDQEDPTINSSQAGHMVDAIQIKLLLGEISPFEAQSQIKTIQLKPLQSSYWSNDVQAHMSYLLGLAQELDGKSDQAAQTYLELWQDYPYSAYAVMAKAKLQAVQ